MKYRPYCIPCFLRRTLHTAELATSDEWLHRKILGEIMTVLVHADDEATPAEVVHRIFRKTAHTLGLADPYAEERKGWLEEVLTNASWIRERIDRDPDPYLAAIKLAISANQLDNELRPILTLKGLVEGLDHVSFDPESVPKFQEAVTAAEKVLYIHDTAGELFFDRMLIEKMGKSREAVVSVVRKDPILTDATREDALAVGLEQVVGEVIDPGCDCQGVPLDECSEEFRSRFDGADLIVVKGQAGYQTLEGREARPGGEERDIFFLFSVKCPVMASYLGVSLGDLVLERS
jgi:damage-control phosphatase, subfamily I